MKSYIMGFFITLIILTSSGCTTFDYAINSESGLTRDWRLDYQYPSEADIDFYVNTDCPPIPYRGTPSECSQRKWNLEDINPHFCEISESDTCFRDSAIRHDDLRLCDEINETEYGFFDTYREDCYSKIYVNRKDFQKCETLTIKEARDYCFFWLGSNMDNVSLCDRMSDESGLKDQCYVNVDESNAIIPEADAGFSIVGDQFDSVGEPIDIGGKLAFMAFRNGRNVIYYDGNDIGTEYSVVTDLTEVNDKVTFIAARFITPYLVYGDIEIPINYTVNMLTGIGGKLAYVETRESGKYVVFDYTTLGQGYDYVADLVDVDGKPAYIAKKGDETYIVYNGEEYGKEYDFVSNLTEVGGDIAYLAEHEGKSFVVWGGNEIGKEYEWVNYPREVNGKLIFKARDDGVLFLDYDGEKLGLGYDTMGYPTEINGKLAFRVLHDGKDFAYFDGVEYGKDTDKVANIANIGGEFAYRAKKNDYWFIYYKGQEIGSQFTSIGRPIDIGGKLAFRAYQLSNKEIKNFIVIED